MEKRERKATTGISTDDAPPRSSARRSASRRRRRCAAAASARRSRRSKTAEAKWRAAGENAKSRLVRKLFRGCVARGQLDEWRWKRDRPDEPLWDMLAACADEFWGDAVSDRRDPSWKTADERRNILAVDPSSGFAFCDLLWGEDESSSCGTGWRSTRAGTRLPRPSARSSRSRTTRRVRHLLRHVRADGLGAVRG